MVVAICVGLVLLMVFILALGGGLSRRYFYQKCPYTAGNLAYVDNYPERVNFDNGAKDGRANLNTGEGVVFNQESPPNPPVFQRFDAVPWECPTSQVPDYMMGAGNLCK